MTTASTVVVECKTFKPVSINTQTKEFATGVSGTGVVKGNTFNAEIIKNNNKESFSFPIDSELTFFSMAFKKYPLDYLIKGVKKTFISEESLNKIDVSFSGKKESDAYEINVNFSGVPITFHIINGIVTRSELQNGLISYRLIKSSGTEIEKNLSVEKSQKNADIVALTKKTNRGINIKNPRKTKNVTFRLHGKDLPVIPSNCYQSVTKNNDFVVVTLNHDRFPCAKGDVDSSYLLPNIFEDSDSPEIKNAALKLLKSSKNNDEAIRKTITFVFKHIRNKNYKHGNLSASETLKKRAGDCTEHSTLLSALLKSMNIHVRMVYGIVLDDSGDFFFHNWNEVHTENGWIAVDSTFGMQFADAARIVLAYGSNDSSSREQVALTVLRFLAADLEISVEGFVYE